MYYSNRVCRKREERRERREKIKIVNSTRAFKCSQSIMVKQLVLSWKQCLKLFNRQSLERRKDSNALETEVMSVSRLLRKSQGQSSIKWQGLG